jgi:hypothetical protein
LFEVLIRGEDKYALGARQIATKAMHEASNNVVCLCSLYLNDSIWKILSKICSNLLEAVEDALPVKI